MHRRKRQTKNLKTKKLSKMENVSITKENLKLAISALDELTSNLTVKLCERDLTNDVREHYQYKLDKAKVLSRDLFNQLISM